MMTKLYRKLKEYDVEMTIRVTADEEHVRFGFIKDGIPGGRIFSFWELENMRNEAIEDQLIRTLDSLMRTVKILKEYDSVHR